MKFKEHSSIMEDATAGLKKKAEKSGMPLGILRKVYNRGMAAWKSGHRPGATQQQWGFARVNSFITKGKGTWGKADSDLAAKVRGSAKKEDVKNESINHSDAHRDAQTHSDGSMSVKKIPSMIKKKGDKHLHLHMKSYHKEKDGQTFAKKHGYKVKNYVKTQSGSRMDIHKENVNEIVDPMDLRGRPKKKDPYPNSPYGMKHPLHPLNIQKRKAKDKAKKIKAMQQKEAVKYPHMMYDPKTGKEVTAKTPMDHAKFSKMGYTHEKPKINEISKGLAKSYIGKAARDMYHKGQDQGNKDAISRLGGPDVAYKKSPERKAAMRARGVDRATKRLARNEADDYHYSTGERIKKKPVKKEAMSDAEKAAHQKAIDAFKAKGGKIKKLKPGYAAGYHGKSDPGAGIKGMIDKGDTKQFATRKKIGSMR